MFAIVARSARLRLADTRAVKLDELSNDAFLSKHLRDGEHSVRCRYAFEKTAVELESDNLRNQHRQRLAEHRALCLDSTYAPAHDAQSVDHRRVRIRADQGVGIGAGEPFIVPE